MADAAAAEMEKMKVEDEKKEVVTALAGAFGVAPPSTPGVWRDPFARRSRAALILPSRVQRRRLSVRPRIAPHSDPPIFDPDRPFPRPPPPAKE